MPSSSTATASSSRATSNEQAPLLGSSTSSTSYGANEDAAAASPPAESDDDDIPFPPLKTLLPLLFCIWVPVFAASLDGTIVSVLVSSIASSFEASEQSSWLGASYLLSVCCFTPIYGRLCDIIGRRYAMLTALSFFCGGTLACGMAQSMTALIVARAIAGAGGGGLTVVTSTIMSDVIPLRSRGLMQGLTNIVFGFGASLGGPVGGVMNDTFGWRSAFLVQVPVLCIALLSAFFVRFDAQGTQKPSPLAGLSARDRFLQIDLLGSLFLVGGVGSTLIALSSMSADDRTFGDWHVWGGLLVGAVSFVLFVLVEMYVARKPILPIRLLKQRTGGSVAVNNFMLSVSSFALLYTYPQYFQAVRLQSASQAGLHLIPNSVALSVSSVLAGLYMRWRGVYWRYNLAHAALMVLGSVMISCFTDRTPEWLTYVAVIPLGFGISGVLTCTLIALINSVSRADIAVATAGISYLFRTSGQVVGVSLSGAILQYSLRSELRQRITGPGAEEIIASIRHQSSIVPTLPRAQREAAVAAYSISLRRVFIFIAVSSALTMLSAATIEDRRLPDLSKPKTPESGDAETREEEEENEV